MNDYTRDDVRRDDDSGHALTRRQALGIMGSGLLLVTASQLLSACGASDSKGSSSPSMGASSPSGTVKRGGSLRVGMGGGSSKDNLSAIAAFTEADVARAGQLYDTLMFFDEDFKLQMALAEEVTPSKDARTWTIRIRDGVEFHDGRTLTSQDVKYTFETVTDPKNPGGAAGRLTTLDRSSLKVMDSQTLRLTFEQPYSPFPDVLAEWFTAGIRIIPATGYDPLHPVGTGPFKFQSFTPGGRSVFVRNANYWREGEPYVDEVVMIDLTDDTARVNALLSGEVDAIAGVPSSQVLTIEQNNEFTTISSPSGRWDPFVMDTTAAPFDDVRVRQAFRLMTDRQQMIDQVLVGRGAIANDIYGRYDPAYNQDVPQREVDINEAKSLLQQAGHDGLAVDLVTCPMAAHIMDAAQSLVQQASKAGVTIKLRQVESSVFWSTFFLKTPFTQQYWGGRNFLLQAADSLRASAPYPETHWHNEKWSTLVDQAFASTDEMRRSELIQEAQAIEYESGGYINWGWIEGVDAVRSNVRGFVPDKSGNSLTSFRLRQAWLDA